VFRLLLGASCVNVVLNNADRTFRQIALHVQKRPNPFPGSHFKQTLCRPLSGVKRFLAANHNGGYLGIDNVAHKRMYPPWFGPFAHRDQKQSRTPAKFFDALFW
jgi:hypothetical protein